MATIWVIPLEGNPLLFNDCPRGTMIGGVRIRWAELKFVHASGTNDGELHCSCSQGVTCCSYSVDTRAVMAGAELLRRTQQPVQVPTLNGSERLELRLLELRPAGYPSRRVAHDDVSLAHAVA